jgi:L-histidine Nalpha-methyltransferase
MVKDEATLVRAYDDKAGVTAAFNLNILHRLNRELGADFDTGCFRHRARWNRGKSRMEMHLESARDQHVYIAAARLAVQFAAFETIHTENSYKFTWNTLRALLDDSGFAIEQTWTDPRQWYALTLVGLRESTVNRPHRGSVMKKMKGGSLADLVNMAAKLGLAKRGA